MRTIHPGLRPVPEAWGSSVGWAAPKQWERKPPEKPFVEVVRATLHPLSYNMSEARGTKRVAGCAPEGGAREITGKKFKLL